MANQRIAIKTEYIRLDAFLKLASAVGSGGEAKMRIAGGEALVNGEVCLLRGKKLRPGDAVRFGDTEYEVAADGA